MLKKINYSIERYALAKIINPTRFSEYFEINEGQLDNLGVLNPTLNVDTKLFIDPLLLQHSKHLEINNDAYSTYKAHFSKVIKFLRRVQQKDDVAWRTAYKLLLFPEIKGTCLGYGAESTSGSGSGSYITGQLLQTALEIVSLGIEDPDLFAVMALLEDGFGPDRISDMTTNVILNDLITFNERILDTLSLSRHKVIIPLNGEDERTAFLPLNPYAKNNVPIILVPADILRSLPIARDWLEVQEAASKNEDLRNKVNRQIAQIWNSESIKDIKTKRKKRIWALSAKENFESLFDMIRSIPPTPYDIVEDPAGELSWRRISATIAQEEPWKLTIPETLNQKGLVNIVVQIIEQFTFLIEKRRLSESLYHQDKALPEKVAQMLFFSVAYAYCKANDVDITIEAGTGNGPVDFKISKGFIDRVVVEIKLSTNSNLVKGYTRQLDAYKNAEETSLGYYVIIDVGQMGNKYEKLLEHHNLTIARGSKTSSITLIDGIRKSSASRLQ